MRRRALLTALPALPMVAATPVVAGVRFSVEHPNDTVRRLGRQIMDALRDPRFIGFNRITITPEYVGYCDNDADTRITYAIAEIVDAFAEKYPGWRPQVINEPQRCLRYVKGQVVEAEMNRHAVLIFAADESHGYRVNGHWHCSYPR